MKLVRQIFFMLMISIISISLFACGNTEVPDEGFTITWKNHDGTTLEIDQQVDANQMPVYDGDTPIKNDSQHEYTFSGWSPMIETVTKDQVYTAQFEQGSIKSYTVTWQDTDGTVLASETLDYGSMPQRDLPQDNAQFSYTEWSPALDIVNGNITYVAQRSIKSYTILWLDTTNALLGTTTVEYGQTPNFELPADTMQWDYTSWSPQIVTVTGETAYQAQRNLQSYTVTFDTLGGSSIIPVTKDYGETQNEPNEPTKEGYVFVGWTYDIEHTEPVTWPITIESNLTLYASWNELVPYGTYLEALLNNYLFDPYSFIPEEMQPGYNLMDQVDTVIDFSSFVDVNTIPYGGFGEQWQMVITNIEQSQVFFNVLSIVDTLSASSITAFNNYLDSNPADTSSYTFLDGIYNVTIQFENDLMYYVLDYTADLPVFGEQTVQIALSYQIETQEKIGRIQIGDANALRYEISEDSYEFAIKYLGIRRAYINLDRNEDESIEGNIFEYLGVDGVYSLGSSAQFYIQDEYVSVVGNKSSGMMGFTGTINELYDITSGALLGYEVRETLSSITYNTLWFNLDDTAGITSIKVEVAPEEESNPHYIYVNDVNQVFETKAVGGFSTKTLSRRYDIEMRKQYVYYQDGEDILSIAIDVPMLFVQAEQLDTLETDVVSENTPTISSFSLDVNSAVIDQIENDYETLIDIFIAQKDDMDAEAIITVIGDAYIHPES